MHGESVSWGYGFWSLVVVNAAIFILFALSFLTPVRPGGCSRGSACGTAS